MNNNLVAKVTADTSDFTSGMASIGGVAGMAATAAITAIVGIGAALIKIQTETIGAAKSFETLEARVKTLLRSNLLGKKQFEEIRKEVAKLPIDSKEAIATYAAFLALTPDAELAGKVYKDIAMASKLMGANAEVSGKQIGMLFLKMDQGKKGMELVELITSAAPVFGRYTSELADMAKAAAKAGIGTEALKERMLEIIKIQGDAAGKQLLNTAEGLEAVLGGTMDEFKADLGAKALIEYKDLLRELIKLIGELKREGIGEKLAVMLNQLVEMLKSDEFKSLIKDLVTIAEAFLQATNLAIAAREPIQKTTLLAAKTSTLATPLAYMGPMGQGIQAATWLARKIVGKPQQVVVTDPSGKDSLNPKTMNEAFE